MAAAQISRRQMGGDSMAAFLRPQPATLLRNHAKDNVRAMREKERQLRGQRMLEAQTKPAEPFKLRQFSDVGSRVLQPFSKKPAARSASLSAITGAAAARSPAPERRGSGDSEPGEIGLDDFEDQVANLIKQHGNKSRQQDQLLTKDANGCPAYLQKMKEDREEKTQAEIAERSKPKVPAGCRQLPAEEIEDTLAALKKKRDELQVEFRRLPLQIETDSQKRREKALMDKIEETDKAINTFSKPQIFVAA